MIKEMLSMSCNEMFFQAFNEIVSNQSFGIKRGSKMYRILEYIINRSRNTVFDFVSMSKDELLGFHGIGENNVQQYRDLQCKIIVEYHILQEVFNADPTDLHNPEC